MSNTARSARAGVALACLCLAVGAAGTARAAGFAIAEQGAKGLGEAYAGGAASADDASTVFFNPAGMTRLSGDHVSSALDVIVLQENFHNGGSVINPSLPGAFGGGTPLSGGNGGDAGVVAPIPNLYLVHSVSDRLKLGLSLTVPFGLETQYDPGWVGRYHAIRSKLQILDVSPAIAYRINDQLSAGIGLDIQHASAKLSNALDFSTICLGSLGAGCAALGLTTPGNPGTDGQVGISADSNALGFNFGVLYTPTETTRFGIQFRSAVTHELKGGASFTLPAGAVPLAQASGRFTPTGIQASLPLPARLSFSAYHRIDARWAVMGDVTWTQWSRFQQLAIRFDNPLQPTSITPEHWKDAMRYAAGVTYRVREPLTLRAGVAYDESPVPNARLRTPRIPDDNRLYLAVGASYRYSTALSADIGYAHIVFQTPHIDNVDVNTGHVLRGKYAAAVDVVGMQLDLRF